MHDLVKTAGIIKAQRRLTHDIVAIEIELEQAMPYTAGMFAELSVPGLYERPRSYSFAAAPRSYYDRSDLEQNPPDHKTPVESNGDPSNSIKSKPIQSKPNQSDPGQNASDQYTSDQYKSDQYNRDHKKHGQNNQPQNQVEFFVRIVPGGEMSTGLNSEACLGQSVELHGPFGDFYLRESDLPMICIAGGSGLAPILALLQSAVELGLTRDIILLFGARTQADLYCLEEINDLKKCYPDNFQFIPVLSEEPSSSKWQGARGLVTQTMEAVIEGDCQVYMCGPPAMIDAAEVVTEKFCIRKTNVFYDKFLDQSHLDTANATAVEVK